MSVFCFHIKFQTEKEWMPTVLAVFPVSHFAGRKFAGSLTAPTMESAELRDGTLHAALGSIFGRQMAETNQIMLILFRGERKAKSSLWQKANWFMGKCVPGFFVRRAKVPIIFISGSLISFIFAHNKGKVPQSICHGPISGYFKDLWANLADLIDPMPPAHFLCTTLFNPTHPRPPIVHLFSSSCHVVFCRPAYRSSAPHGGTWWCCFNGWQRRWPPAATTTVWSWLCWRSETTWTMRYCTLSFMGHGLQPRWVSSELTWVCFAVSVLLNHSLWGIPAKKTQ